jgi:hypothetical protein
MSSAVRLFGSDWVDMAPGDRTGGGASRNGFLETGRGGGSSKGDAGEAGDAARLRKGLLEDRLIVSPAEGSWPDGAEFAKAMVSNSLKVQVYGRQEIDLRNGRWSRSRMVLSMVAGVGRRIFEATAAVLYAPSRVKGTGNRRMQLRSVWRVSADW